MHLGSCGDRGALISRLSHIGAYMSGEDVQVDAGDASTHLIQT